MVLALSAWVLFILVMQSVNGAQVLSIIFLLALIVTPTAPVMFRTVIVPLTSMSHKIKLILTSKFKI